MYKRQIQTIFSSIIYAISEFREVIATIALVTAFSKCLRELGSDALLMKPVSKVMRTPAVSWWILGGIMFVFSLFLWPSPAVALVGAIVLPIAVQSGLTPLAAAMAMKNLLGLACDPVAGLVEVPCVKRNVVGAVNALSAADMALAGVRSIIPPDEVFDAMRSVGISLPEAIRETGKGGLAATTTGQKIAQGLQHE